LLSRTVLGLKATVLSLKVIVVAAIRVLGVAVNVGATIYIAVSIAIALVNHLVWC